MKNEIVDESIITIILRYHNKPPGKKERTNIFAKSFRDQNNGHFEILESLPVAYMHRYILN